MSTEIATDSETAITRGEPLLTSDNRCSDQMCADRDIYRMIGHCYNCKTSAILGLFTVRHGSIGQRDCPVCGCRTVEFLRLATPDEIGLEEPSHAH
ncbi:MAG: hypothetical protein WBF51_04055 [Candidatus Dormiibacterota bacterium]